MCSKAHLWTTVVKNWYQWKHLTTEVKKKTESFFVAITTEREEMNYN